MITSLPYKPYGAELSGIPHVFVDGLRTPDTVLELSHWPGNRTPSRFKADVSSQAVLALVADPACERFTSRAQAVSCDHYDVDGLLSVWCLVAPALALTRRRLVEQTAFTGDFDVWTSASAVKACLALEAAERLVAAEMARIGPSDTNAASEMFFRSLLGQLPELLHAPSSVDGWQLEYEQIVAAMHKLDRSPDLIEELPHLDLAVLAPSSGLHRYAVHAHTQLLHVAGSDVEGRHWLYQRYESFVDLQSRQTAPRVRGELLAAELNERERAGTWMCETPDTATPCLQLYAPSGAPAPSSLPWATFIALVVGFFERAATDPAMRWDRRADWYITSDVAPPSGLTA